MKMDPYLAMYPYWTQFPLGWNYPAACASGKTGRGGWAASIDDIDGNCVRSALLTTVLSMSGAKCGSCTGGCTFIFGT
jgi:hypothetical protein